MMISRFQYQQSVGFQTDGLFSLVVSFSWESCRRPCVRRKDGEEGEKRLCDMLALDVVY